MNMKNKKAFTLAEVLVSLTIIGVIAAVALSTLKDTSDKSTNIALMKKAYATASNAFAQLEAENGAPIYWMQSDNKTRVFDGNATGISKALKSKMNVAKDNVTGYSVVALNGKTFSSVNSLDLDTSVTFATADGMYWLLTKTSSGCADNKCGMLLVDINSSQKPNKVGYDVFDFVITPDGIIPFDNNDCSSSGAGHGCAAKVIKEGDNALDFLYE